MNNKRDISIDALKGVAIILVMFGHVLVWNKIEDDYIYNMIKAVQMPLFIVISGYLMGFKPPVDTLEKAVMIIKRRAMTYLLPFFSWLVLKYWRNLGWGIRNVLFNLDRGLWFLMTLFILSVTLIIAQLVSVKLYSNYIKDKRFRELLFWLVELILIIVFFLQSRAGNTFLSPNLTVFYAPFFLGGYFIKYYEKELCKIFKIFVKRKALIIEGIVGIILWLGISICFNFSNNSELITTIMQLAAGAAGSFGLLAVFLNTKENAFKEKLAFIGKYTLEIYVLHFHFATIINNGISYKVWNESSKSVMFTVVSFGIMSFITFLIIWIVKKYIPILDLLLFGKKPSKSIQALHSKH